MSTKTIAKEGELAVGRKQLRKHASGKKITALNAIWAKCYDCCNGSAQDIKLCDIKDCPLWPHNFYVRKKKVQFKRNQAALEKARKTKTKRED